MTRMFPTLHRTLLYLLPPVIWWAWWPNLAEPFQIKTHLAAIGATLVWLTGMACRPTGHLPTTLTLGWLGLLAAAAVSTLHSAEPGVAARCALSSLPIWCLIGTIRRDHIGGLQAAMWLGGAGVALMVCMQHLGWDGGFQARDKLGAYATLGNANWVAVLLVSTLPLAVDQARRRWEWWPLLPLWLGALAWTQARQAWVALGVVVMLAAWLYCGRRVRLAIVAGVIALVALAIWGLPQIHSVQGRALIMAAVAQMTWDRPWTGVGLGMVDPYYPAYQAKLLASPAWAGYVDHAAAVFDAHNEWLQWAATTGLPGALALSWLTGATLWLGWHSATVRQTYGHWYLAYAGMLVTWLVTGVQTVPALVLLFALVQGVLGAALVNERRPWPVWANRSAAILGVILLAGTVAWAWQETRASWSEGAGDSALQERDAWLAREHYQRALTLNPRRGALWKKLASVEYLEGRPDKALAALAQATRFTGDPGVALLRGEILAKQGRDAEAIATYQTLRAAYPHLITVHFVLGQLQARQGDLAAAKRSLQRVMQIQPSAHNQQFSSAKVSQQKAAAERMLAQWR